MCDRSVSVSPAARVTRGNSIAGGPDLPCVCRSTAVLPGVTPRIQRSGEATSTRPVTPSNTARQVTRVSRIDQERLLPRVTRPADGWDAAPDHPIP